MGKNVLLPETILVDIYRLIFYLEDYELDYNVHNIIKRLENSINAKLEAKEKRRAYTEYKLGETDEAKETARQKYLELAGIHCDWRWGAEAERQRRKGCL